MKGGRLVFSEPASFQGEATAKMSTWLFNRLIQRLVLVTFHVFTVNIKMSLVFSIVLGSSNNVTFLITLCQK